MGPRPPPFWLSSSRNARRRLQGCATVPICRITRFWQLPNKTSRGESSQGGTSARAWVSIADRVEEKQHQQIERTLLAISVPIDNSSDPFDRVIRARKGASTALENFIAGSPQRIHSGAVRLAPISGCRLVRKRLNEPHIPRQSYLSRGTFDHWLGGG